MNTNINVDTKKNIDKNSNIDIKNNTGTKDIIRYNLKKEARSDKGQA